MIKSEHWEKQVKPNVFSKGFTYERDMESPINVVECIVSCWMYSFYIMLAYPTKCGNQTVRNNAISSFRNLGNERFFADCMYNSKGWYKQSRLCISWNCRGHLARYACTRFERLKLVKTKGNSFFTRGVTTREFI